MKIGISNTLFGAIHLPYWQLFFSFLGLDVVIPGPSRKETVDCGGKLIPPEFCIPVKACLGQLVELMEKDVELILLPRMIQKGRRDFFCPKFTGLPELAKYSAGIEPGRLFSPEVICDGWQLRPIRYSAAISPPGKLGKAAEQAGLYWNEILTRCRRERLILPEALNLMALAKPAGIRVGLLGYSYTLYDPFISKGIIHKLTALGAELRTWEMVDPVNIESSLKGLKRPLFWNFGRVLLGAGLHFLKDPEVDGVVYVTAFGCGPDSIAVKMLELEAGKSHKPFLRITLDEHSGDGHLLTRLEAFLDMLVEKKEEARA